MPRKFTHAQFVISDVVDSVRDWLDDLERRAASDALKGDDLVRLKAAKVALHGEPDLQTLQARAVKVIAAWRKVGTTDTRPLQQKLAELDATFGSSELKLNRDDVKALTGNTKTKRLSPRTLAARLSLRAGALGCTRTDSPDAVTIESTKRIFRQAAERKLGK